MSLMTRQALVAVRFLVLMTVVLGLVYPGVIWAVGQLVSTKADGSLVTDASGRTVGSSLLGQGFDGPAWFHPRPSAAGDGYDATASGGSNLSADNPDLLSAIEERRTAVVEAEGVRPDQVPADALLASASGLDPHISPEYAAIQIARVARERRLPIGRVQELVADATEGRLAGFIGEPRVDVLALNRSLPSATG